MYVLSPCFLPPFCFKKNSRVTHNPAMFCGILVPHLGHPGVAATGTKQSSSPVTLNIGL